jgi:aspartyl-tRNA(Asn)/glutamyl-tRNA(Gln) amidotransferase subunit B
MKYEPVIGMEIHVELLTESKVFCSCPAHFVHEPNAQMCPVCLGLPGVLPVLNRKAFELAIRTALALNCDIPSVTKFDRKNYYYPDLPKNFQISQQYEPLGRNGMLTIPVNGGTRDIGIDNIHLEEDAGKNVHPEEKGLVASTLVDLNRAGRPLLEIVSKPDIRNFEELESYMETMRQVLRYIEVSDCKIQEGSIRFELNISLRPEGSEKLGTKVEVKNVASVKSVLRAAAFETERQTDILEAGKQVVQETRLWSDDDSETRPMRTKETAMDYRYFPEPDLVPLEITSEWLDEIRESIPELPVARRQRLAEQYDIPDYDAGVLVADKSVADFYEECNRLYHSPKAFSNWIMTYILRDMAEKGVEDVTEIAITPSHLAELVQLVDNGTISSKIAKTVYDQMKQTGVMPGKIVEKEGLVQIKDEGALETAVDEAIKANPKAAEEFRDGKDKAIGRLVGHVMKTTQGKANPQIVQEMIKSKLRG